jgi:integrase
MTVLTDTKARNIKPDSLPLPHGGVTGLTLHPSKTKGRGKWVLRYVSPQTGKRRNAGLGSYPEIGIAEVGRLGSEFRIQIANGTDPLEDKKEQKRQEKIKIPSFQEAALVLHQELVPSWKNFKHGQQWINTLTQYVFPIVANKELNEIQPKDIADVLRPIWLEKPETASRVKQRVHAVMAWGWAHGFCQSNPVDVVSYLLPPQSSKVLRTQHQPAMPWEAIPGFVVAHLQVKKPLDASRAMLLFLILTAARSGEVRGMRWSEVDWKNQVWTIPAERMKGGLIHRVPLGKRAIEILKDQKGLHDELVFPSIRDKVVLSDMVLTSFLRRVKAKSSDEGRVATAHGFRSSFRDWCSEHGYERDLAERALAHTIKSQVEAAYHRTDLLDKRRPMMEAWEKHVYSAV